MRAAIYDPFSTTIQRLNDEMYRAFGTSQRRRTAAPVAAEQWVPAVDIHEYADRFALSLDLPGVDPKTIEITVEAGELVVSGEKAARHDVDGEPTTHRSERRVGGFQRRFALPEHVDDNNIEAKSAHGVLEIIVRKPSKVEAKKITVVT